MIRKVSGIWRTRLGGPVTRWVFRFALSVALTLASVQEVTNVQVSNKFIEHIEDIEGFRAQAYRDTGGVLTIGYGHVILPSEGHLKTAVLTRKEAQALLEKDTRNAIKIINSYVTVLLKQEQFDALVSFVFNVGESAFKKSTLLKRLNQGHCCAVPDELRRWVYDNGRRVVGLALRREKEIKLYTGAV